MLRVAWGQNASDTSYSMTKNYNRKRNQAIQVTVLIGLYA
jgi:hypothetical protein